MYTHFMKTTVRSWGNSLGIRIPKVFAMQMGIDSGKEVEISLKKDGLYITPVEMDVQELIDKITTENLHTETSTGSVVGNEIW